MEERTAAGLWFTRSQWARTTRLAHRVNLANDIERTSHAGAN